MLNIYPITFHSSLRRWAHAVSLIMIRISLVSSAAPLRRWL
jgi:hypothetical protein